MEDIFIKTKAYKRDKDFFKYNDFGAFLMPVTPKAAGEIYELSDGNRTLDNNNIKKIQDDIERGKYYPNCGDGGLKFNKDGVLTDGHHTLRAIAKSGKTTTVLVMVGTEHNEVTNSGKTRSVKDSIEMSGEPYKAYKDYTTYIKNIFNIRGQKAPSHQGPKLVEYPINNYKAFIDNEGERFLTIAKEWNKFMARKDLLLVKGLGNTEKSVVVPIMYCLIYDAKQNKDDVMDFFKNIYTMNHQTENNHVNSLNAYFTHLMRIKLENKGDKAKEVMTNISFYHLVVRGYVSAFGVASGVKALTKKERQSNPSRIVILMREEEENGMDYTIHHFFHNL